MADNYEVNAGSGGKTFGSDQIAGVDYPRVKLIIGADGTNDGDVASGNPLPVTGTVAATQSGTWNVTNVSGTVSLPTGAATAAKQPALGTAGTASSDVITVQGIAAMTPILATLSGTNNIATVTTVSAVTAISNALPAGTNNIGDVDILSIAAGDNNIGNVDLASAIPAGTNLIGRISASPETSTVYNGTTALTPKFAVIDNATSGDNTLVAAVTGKKIRVHQLALIGSAAVTVRFESGASGTALTGQMQFAANGGFVLPFSPMGWFETASDALLNMELNGATSVDGVLGYTEV